MIESIVVCDPKGRIRGIVVGDPKRTIGIVV